MHFIYLIIITKHFWQAGTSFLEKNLTNSGLKDIIYLQLIHSIVLAKGHCHIPAALEISMRSFQTSRDYPRLNNMANIFSSHQNLLWVNLYSLQIRIKESSTSTSSCMTPRGPKALGYTGVRHGNVTEGHLNTVNLFASVSDCPCDFTVQAEHPHEPLVSMPALLSCMRGMWNVGVQVMFVFHKEA